LAKPASTRDIFALYGAIDGDIYSIEY